jgi:hypothetical protein
MLVKYDISKSGKACPGYLSGFPSYGRIIQKNPGQEFATPARLRRVRLFSSLRLGVRSPEASQYPSPARGWRLNETTDRKPNRSGRYSNAPALRTSQAARPSKKILPYAFTINAFALFLRKLFSHMAATKRNKGLYFLLFLISTAAFAASIYFHWEYLTLIIPFVCTFFVLSLDII